MTFRLFHKKPLDAEPDEELMKLIHRGNADAFQVLYQRYSDKLYYFLYRMLYQNRELAEDHLQEVFLKVLEKAGSYNPDKRFDTWIFTIARNRCKNHYRDQKPQVQAEEAEFLSAAEPWAESKFDQQVFEQALSEALDELKEIHRTTFILRFQEELPVKEISRIMDCSEGTVKSRIHYCTKYLSGKLQAYHPHLPIPATYEK